MRGTLRDFRRFVEAEGRAHSSLPCAVTDLLLLTTPPWPSPLQFPCGQLNSQTPGPWDGWESARKPGNLPGVFGGSGENDFRDRFAFDGSSQIKRPPAPGSAAREESNGIDQSQRKNVFERRLFKLVP